MCCKPDKHVLDCIINKGIGEESSQSSADQPTTTTTTTNRKTLEDYYVKSQTENQPSSSTTDNKQQQQHTQDVLESNFNNSKHSTSTSTVRSYKSQKSAYSDRPPSEKSYSVAKLPSKRHAILTGSRALIKRIGKCPLSDGYDDDTSFPLCYLLQQPVSLEDVTINSTEGMNNHVLVCLHREVINMFKFIYNLRSPNIKADELQDIVLLCSKKPSPKIFELINTFPKVYFMEVS
ncbi:hypothetical protein HPULCUR_005885 [Helicostylum pulchrum]|uniref:RCK N-terminal domain-containing protein n=1 Tax=Helicostylum pulchrum TaxID=562976 RepID=A0ABP9Y171_9FUNG